MQYVTIDETWIHHYTPESNQQSAEWRANGEKRPKTQMSTSMKGRTINSECYPCRNFDRGLEGTWRVCPISSRDLAWKTSQGPVGNVTLLSRWAPVDFLVGV